MTDGVAESIAAPLSTDLSLRRDRILHAGTLLALGGLYVVVGKLGLAMSPVSGFATLVWSPTGLSLAALIIGGYRLWPAVAAGALVTNLWVGAPPLVACGIAAGNTLEALVGAFALRSIPGFERSLERFKDVIGLVVLAGIGSTAISATVGTASLTLGGVIKAADFARTWQAWWAGDLIGDLIVAPLLLTWTSVPRGSTRPSKLAEAVALGALLVACAALVFAEQPEPAAQMALLQPYVLFIPLTWTALRYGARGAATGMFLLAAIAVWATYTGHGPFVRASRTESLIALHVFLGSASLASLVLGGVVSERRRSRQALSEGEAMLRGIIEGATDAVYVKDRLGRYVVINAAGAFDLGAPAGAVIGKDDAALLPAGEARLLRAADEEVMRTGQPRTTEESLTAGGVTRVFHTTKTPYRNDAGEVLGIIGISRDVTERKRAEAMRESAERQRLAVEAAHLGMWFWDMKNDRLAWTPLCRSMHGIGPEEEVSYARFLVMLHPDDRRRIERAVERSLAERTEYLTEYRVVWPDGTVHWVSALGRTFFDEAGEPERMLGTATDITAQKQAEQERAEALVREQEARAEAQAATRAKDDFLAVVSHELRTPLQAMLGWTQMLKAPGLDERAVQKGLQTIERNVETQVQLIEDLLDVSRIVSGKLRLRRERVELAAVVESALESVKVAAEAKSIQVDAAFEPGAGEVLGDPDRLLQVVSNLLSNAVKFTPNGGRVGVRLEREGAAARITVADTGCGISPEFLPHVFDRFRQAESVTRRWHGGLGLGLAIVRHLVELHEGTVKAASPGEGWGATFTVTLPLAGAGQRTVAVESGKPTPRGSWKQAVLDGVHVLVVDDDQDSRELLEAVLRRSGAEVRAVESARAALAELASFNPQLLLSDIAMPEEDGYALIRQVRAREAASGGHVLAVALTAFASPADREQALAGGFDAHLAKPVSAGDLAQTVATMVGRAA